MDNLFKQFELDFEIVSEDKKHSKSKNEPDREEVRLDIKESLGYSKSIDKIEIIKTSNIKTSNSFINTVQQNEQRKIQKEIERVKRADTNFPYIRGVLLTNAEKQLFYFMSNQLDRKEQVLIFPKVRLADVIEVDEKITLNKKPFYKIASKHIDYLMVDKQTLEIICAVELDDFTHDNDASRERDCFVMEALYNVGIETIRIKTPIKTICKADIEMLDEKLNEYFAPDCPYCGIKMRPRKSTNRNNKGHRFYSCPNYLNGCRYTINIDQGGEKLP